MTLTNSTTEDLFCPQCGYNLHGLSSANCPECGLALDRAAMARSRLPWTHRQRIGRVRAYWRTLVLGTFSTPELANELSRPVSYRDAQLFRFVTIAIAWVPLAATAMITSYVVSQQTGWLWRGFGTTTLAPGGGASIDIFWPLAAGAVFPGVVPLALALFLIMLSGVSSYFFHPSSMPTRLQNRGIAMSYYSSAAIAFLPISLIITVAAVALANTDWASSNSGFKVMAIVGILAVASPCILLFLWWVNTLRLYHRATKAGWMRLIGMAMLLPILWLCCVALTLFAVTWTCGFVILLIQSVQ